MSALILGQAYPTDTANTDVYTVPASTEAVGSTLILCGGSADVTVSAWLRKNGAAAAPVNRVLNALPVKANSHIGLTYGWAMAAGDKLTVAVSTGSSVSFTFLGDAGAAS